MDNVQIVLLCIGIAVVAAAAAGIPLFFAGVSHRKKVAEAEIGSAEEQAKKVLNDAYKTAESRKKELLVEAREEIHQLRSEADRDIKERRGEVSRQERRIQQKEESLTGSWKTRRKKRNRSSLGWRQRRKSSLKPRRSRNPSWNSWSGSRG